MIDNVDGRYECLETFIPPRLVGLLLWPVKYAAPAMVEFLTEYGEGPNREEDCRGLHRMVARFSFVSTALSVYIEEVSGVPSRNLVPNG